MKATLESVVSGGSYSQQQLATQDMCPVEADCNLLGSSHRCFSCYCTSSKYLLTELIAQTQQLLKQRSYCRLSSSYHAFSCMSEGVLGVLARRLHGVLLSQKPLIEMCWLPADLGVSVLHN